MLLTHRQARPDRQFPGISFDAPFSISRAKYKPLTLGAGWDMTFGHATGCDYVSDKEIRPEYLAHTEFVSQALRASIVGDMSAPEFILSGGMRYRAFGPAKLIKSRG